MINPHLNNLLMYAHEAKILSCFLNLGTYTAYFLNLGTYCILFRLNKTTDGLVDIQNAIKLKDQIKSTFCILARDDHFNGDKKQWYMYFKIQCI